MQSARNIPATNSWPTLGPVWLQIDEGNVLRGGFPLMKIIFCISPSSTSSLWPTEDRETSKTITVISELLEHLEVTVEALRHFLCIIQQKYSKI